MSFVSKLYNPEEEFNFPPLWKKTQIVSAVLAVASIVLVAVVGLNQSIDFEGGGIFAVPVADDVDVAEARDVLGPLGADARIQRVEDADAGAFIQVRIGIDALDQRQDYIDRLAELAGGDPNQVSENTVGPTWGSQITSQALRALAIFFVVVAIYLAVTLEWRMAAAALIAVAHDLAITAGVYALFRFVVSPATVIALLTILGYSLYDTVVVFDKVKERLNDRRPITPISALTARAMNEVLARSVNTTFTTVIPVLSMLVIGSVVLGGVTLREFGLALFVGLILGTYSSLFVAAPAFVLLRERFPETGSANEDKLKNRISAQEDAKMRNLPR